MSKSSKEADIAKLRNILKGNISVLEEKLCCLLVQKPIVFIQGKPSEVISLAAKILFSSANLAHAYTHYGLLSNHGKASVQYLGKATYVFPEIEVQRESTFLLTTYAVLLSKSEGKITNKVASENHLWTVVYEKELVENANHKIREFRELLKES